MLRDLVLATAAILAVLLAVAVRSNALVVAEVALSLVLLIGAQLSIPRLRQEEKTCLPVHG